MTNRNIKMVGLDLDGTLLTTQKKITEYTRNVIREATEQGCIVLAATGRPVSAVPEEILKVAGKRYMVTVNGAVIVDMENRKTIYENLLPVDMAVKALEIFGEYDVLTEVFIDDTGYSAAGAMEHVEDYVVTPGMIKYMKESRVPVADVKTTLLEMNKPIGKAHAIFRYPEQRAEVMERIKKVLDVDLTSSSPRDLDVNTKGTNKGVGLVRLGQILGIRREEIMACGDSFNDIEMLKEAGLGVAMGNAEDEVKKIADYVTETNDNDGVAKAIERFVLR